VVKELFGLNGPQSYSEFPSDLGRIVMSAIVGQASPFVRFAATCFLIVSLLSISPSQVQACQAVPLTKEKALERAAKDTDFVFRGKLHERYFRCLHRHHCFYDIRIEVLENFGHRELKGTILVKDRLMSGSEICDSIASFRAGDELYFVIPYDAEKTISQLVVPWRPTWVPGRSGSLLPQWPERDPSSNRRER
jgi:hypothetical protein